MSSQPSCPGDCSACALSCSERLNQAPPSAKVAWTALRCFIAPLLISLMLLIPLQAYPGWQALALPLIFWSSARILASIPGGRLL